MSGIIFFIVFAIIVMNLLSYFAKQAKKNEKGGSFMPPPDREKKNPVRYSSSPFLMVQKTRLNGVWMESAGEMSLSFLRPDRENPFPGIGGDLEGMPLTVTVRENPENGEFETCYKILYPEDLGLDFYFVKASADRIRSFSKGKKRWDGLDGELPENVKKEEIFLTAKEGKILPEYLNSSRKETLFWCLGSLEELFIDDNSITLRFQGMDDTTDEITSRIRLILQLARTFGFPDEKEKEEYKKIYIPCAAVPVPEREKVLPEREKNITPSPDEKKEEGRKTVLPPIVPPFSSPEKREMENKKELETTPAGQIPSSESLQKEELSGDRVLSPLSYEEMAKHLFSRTFPTQEEKEYFEARKGSVVTWKGVLQSAYEYSSDFIFGNGGGVKAKFLLMEYKEEGSFLTRKIFAVVSFPKSESAKLRESMGKMFTFSGKLFRFESIAKEIMLSEGTLAKE